MLLVWAWAAWADPDIVVGPVVSEGAAPIGQLLPWSVELRNDGDALDEVTEVVLRLSDDDRYDPLEDAPFCHATVPEGLPAGASRVVRGACVVPDLAVGAWQIVARASCPTWRPDLDLSNDEAAGPAVEVGASVGALAAADLVVGSLVAGPATAGGGVRVELTVRNVGDVASAAGEVVIVGSDDGRLDPSDPVWCAVPLSPIAAGGEQSGVVTDCAVPAGVARTARLFAVVDREGAVPESDDRNNVGEAAVAVSALPAGGVVGEPADLRVAVLTTTGEAAPGGAVTLGWTLRNAGAGPAAPSTLAVRWSADRVWEAADPLVCTAPLPALGAGASADGLTRCVLPQGAPVGAGYLIAYADSGLTVAESDEANNARAAELIVVATAPAPDLIAVDPSTPPPRLPGQSFDLTWVARNEGAAASRVNRARAWLWAQEDGSGRRVAVCEGPVDALEPGASEPRRLCGCTIPANWREGPAWLRVVVDDDRQVDEPDEDNNVLVVPVMVGAEAETDDPAGVDTDRVDTDRPAGGETGLAPIDGGVGGAGCLCGAVAPSRGAWAGLVVGLAALRRRRLSGRA